MRHCTKRIRGSFFSSFFFGVARFPTVFFASLEISHADLNSNGMTPDSVECTPGKTANLLGKSPKKKVTELPSFFSRTAHVLMKKRWHFETCGKLEKRGRFHELVGEVVSTKRVLRGDHQRFKMQVFCRQCTFSGLGCRCAPAAQTRRAATVRCMQPHRPRLTNASAAAAANANWTQDVVDGMCIQCEPQLLDLREQVALLRRQLAHASRPCPLTRVTEQANQTARKSMHTEPGAHLPSPPPP